MEKPYFSRRRWQFVHPAEDQPLSPSLCPCPLSLRTCPPALSEPRLSGGWGRGVVPRLPDCLKTHQEILRAVKILSCKTKKCYSSSLNSREGFFLAISRICLLSWKHFQKPVPNGPGGGTQSGCHVIRKLITVSAHSPACQSPPTQPAPGEAAASRTRESVSCPSAPKTFVPPRGLITVPLL